jgi:uncharacterized protein (TIGR03790 family)
MQSGIARRRGRGPRIALERLEDRKLLSGVNANILVVYNAGFTGDLDGNGVQDSLQVAQYYALKRGVPAANLLGVNPSSDTQITYAQYKTEVAQPVQNKLIALGKTNINYILTIYGMPWKLDNNYSLDNALISPEYSLTRSAVFSISNPYLELNPLYTTAGVYDAGVSDRGHFSHSFAITGGHQIYLVSRLDGPVDTGLGIHRILNLVDQALYAEKYASLTPGYMNGTMYVSSPYSNSFTIPTTDSDIKGGVYSTATGSQKNIGYAARYAELFGMAWKNLGVQNKSAFLYSGWLNYNYYNQNFAKTYQWLPGATGIDFNSYSLGYNIRAVNGTGSFAWGVQALADGITGLSGVTAEPFTTGHSRPNTFNYYLLKGYTLGEAASLANPNVGWMEMTIGDPLYAPFAAKANVLDSLAPVFVPTYPKVTWKSKEGYVVDVLLDDQVAPEAATVKVEFGLTTGYGQSKELTQYYLHHRVPLSDLQDGKTYHYRVIVTDAAGNVTASPDATFQTGAQTPYGGTAWPIAGTIQFENFDVGGEGIAYHDIEPQDVINYNNPRPNEGVEVTYFAPFAIWQVRPGERLEYTTNVSKSGTYTLEVNSQADGAGNQFHIEVDGINVTGTLTTPSTGYGSPYGITTKTGIFLSAGPHVIRVCFDLGVGDGWVGNFDWFKFTFVTPAPSAVTAIHVRSTSWSPEFLQNLVTRNVGDLVLGYKIPTGSANQLKGLPWPRLNQISITFSENVTVTQAALTLDNVPANAFSNFQYNAATKTATWTLTNPLPLANLQLNLPATGANAVVDATGNPLDGEWIDNVSTVSGNNTPGGDFHIHLNVVPGDANGDLAVNFQDFVLLSQAFGQSNALPQIHLTGGSTVGFSDFIDLSQSFGSTLIAPTFSFIAASATTPTAPITTTTFAVSTTPIETISTVPTTASITPRSSFRPVPSLYPRRRIFPTISGHHLLARRYMSFDVQISAQRLPGRILIGSEFKASQAFDG